MNWRLKLTVYSSVGVASSLLLFYLKKYFGGPVCHCVSRLDQKTVVLTGGTSGIGITTVTQLAERGATVLFTARDLEKGLVIRDQIRAETKNSQVHCLQLELNDFSNIRRFISDLVSLLPSIDVLINNAAVFYYPPQKTVNGFDITFQSNYLGHFLLTELLLPKLTAGGRVIFLSSRAHKLCESLDLRSVAFVDEGALGTSARFLNYGKSKLSLLLYSKNLARRLRERRINVYSVDPGSVETPIYRHFPFLQNPILKTIQKPIRYIVVRTPFQGSQTVLHCVLYPHLNDETGLYYSNLKVENSSPISNDQDLSSRLYRQSLIWTNLNN